jgi:hypothetical protein
MVQCRLGFRSSSLWKACRVADVWHLRPVNPDEHIDNNVRAANHVDIRSWRETIKSAFWNGEYIIRQIIFSEWRGTAYFPILEAWPMTQRAWETT